MDMDRLARLTERERAYLRLVSTAMSSKEIALQFGIGPGTVDKALKSAMAKLGTSSRRAAARLLTEAERGQKLAPQPQRLVQDGDPVIMGLSSTDRDWLPRSTSSEAVREEQAPYWATAARWEGVPVQGLRFPFPRHEGERNDLTITHRLLWIGGLTLGIVLVLAALIAISWGSARMIGQILRTLS